MVEGPGATRNARKLQPCIGSVVRDATGGINDKILGAQVVTAFSIGKEVFIVFSNDIALRLHFGMSGCLWLQKSNQSNTTQTRKKDEQNVTMTMKLGASSEQQNCSNDEWTLTCRGTTINQVTCRVAYSKCDRLSKRDACAPDGVFDAYDVLNALKTRPTAMIADVVLDQDRFPGVGNIIKIEGLHQARVHPKQIVSSLSDEQLRAVIAECRSYATRWLKTGRAPTKHVYNQTICQSCQGTVRMQKMGNDLSRVTFWCEECQSPTACSGLKRSSASVNGALVPPPAKVARNNKPPVGVCPQHGSSVQLKRVRKDGVNKNRLFYACKAKTCQYFQWADGQFPTCCGRKTLLRVSKTQHSGGKWFLSCHGCSYFAWASPQQLAPLQTLLTPLL